MTGKGKIIMKSYIISIAVSSVISAVMTMAAPERWAKYIRVVTGLVIAVCIGKSILELMKTDVFEGLEFNYSQNVSYSHEEYRKEVISEMQNRIAEDVRKRLLDEFGTECKAEARLAVNDDNEIIGIDRLIISGGNLDSAAMGRLREVYDVKHIEYTKH